MEDINIWHSEELKNAGLSDSGQDLDPAQEEKSYEDAERRRKERAEKGALSIATTDIDDEESHEADHPETTRQTQEKRLADFEIRRAAARDEARRKPAKRPVVVDHIISDIAVIPHLQDCVEAIGCKVAILASLVLPGTNADNNDNALQRLEEELPHDNLYIDSILTAAS